MADKKYKQVSFNELTLKPLCVDETDMHKRVTLYARTLKEAQSSIGAKMVRYDDDLAGIKLSEDVTLREFWANVMHDVHVMSNGEDVDVKWPCLTAPEHLEEDAFKSWIEEHSEIELVKSELSYEDKIQGVDDNLRDDHGKDVLREHAKRLCHSEYVEGILCSRPFQPKIGTYIHSFTKDGLVDVVLFWDDRGLSMRVKTTGRNVQETAAIAAMLQEKYSR